MRKNRLGEIILFGVGAIVAVNVLRVFGRVWQLWRRRKHPLQPSPTPDQLVTDAMSAPDVQQALRTGDRETATRLVQSRTGAPLGVINRHVLTTVQVAADDAPIFLTLEEALTDAELLDYAEQGLKIHAIKRYRELTGSGLKDAKDTVEYYLF